MTWLPLLTRPVWGSKQAKSLSVVEWGKEHGYSPTHVRHLIRGHKLYAFKHAGKWYIPIKML
ncbi:MAG: hypothetical protein DCF17_21235 [Shackletoniella antarctica]|jgi:hypothetical protein|uniref:DNA-binding protein n=1 Tax=Shackletoniella antarctica TaxID=268115 RepID=A0A2W4XHC3_9CYAN|nr:MAG: hypothetical protein DCF17_21235 [Shackletoniella antarctica]